MSSETAPSQQGIETELDSDGLNDLTGSIAHESNQELENIVLISDGDIYLERDPDTGTYNAETIPDEILYMATEKEATIDVYAPKFVGGRLLERSSPEEDVEALLERGRVRSSLGLDDQRDLMELYDPAETFIVTYDTSDFELPDSRVMSLQDLYLHEKGNASPEDKAQDYFSVTRSNP